MTFDTFDQMFDAPAQQTPAATQSYAIVPAGEADVEIVAASIGDVAWKKTDTNPTGTCLKLRLSAGREFSFVFVDIPREKTFVFKALAAALGMVPGADGKVSIGPVESLVGCRVRIEVGHYQTKSGEHRACVRKWLPAAASPEVASPATAAAERPLRQPRRTKPEWETGDDIPF